MASYIVYAHAERAAGTSSGTFVIPPGMTIYFFEKDEELLEIDGARVLLDMILANPLNEAGVQTIASETKTAWETIPNYKVSGDATMPEMGIYLVGQPFSAGAIVPISYGMVNYVSDLIGSGANKSAIGNTIYWLCCRSAPKNGNNVTAYVKETIDVGGVVHTLTSVNIAAAFGKTPSQIKASGRWR